MNFNDLTPEMKDAMTKTMAIVSHIIEESQPISVPVLDLFLSDRIPTAPLIGCLQMLEEMRIIAVEPENLMLHYTGPTVGPKPADNC